MEGWRKEDELDVWRGTRAQSITPLPPPPNGRVWDGRDITINTGKETPKPELLQNKSLKSYEFRCCFWR